MGEGRGPHAAAEKLGGISANCSTHRSSISSSCAPSPRRRSGATAFAKRRGACSARPQHGFRRAVGGWRGDWRAACGVCCCVMDVQVARGRDETCPVSTGGRDETCPVSTGGRGGAQARGAAASQRAARARCSGTGLFGCMNRCFGRARCVHARTPAQATARVHDQRVLHPNNKQTEKRGVA